MQAACRCGGSGDCGGGGRFAFPVALACSRYVFLLIDIGVGDDVVVWVVEWYVRTLVMVFVAFARRFFPGGRVSVGTCVFCSRSPLPNPTSPPLPTLPPPSEPPTTPHHSSSTPTPDLWTPAPPPLPPSLTRTPIPPTPRHPRTTPSVQVFCEYHLPTDV